MTEMKTNDRDQQSTKVPIIGITSGDAAGIGPEIIVKVLSQLSISKAVQFVIYSRKDIIEHAIKRFSLDLHYEVLETVQSLQATRG